MVNAVRVAFAERLTLALNEAGYRGLTLLKLGKEFGVSAQAVRKWLTAEALPTTVHAFHIAAKLGVRRAWLMDGEEPARALATPESRQDDQLLALSSEEYQLLLCFRKLSPPLQIVIRTLVSEIRPQADSV